MESTADLRPAGFGHGLLHGRVVEQCTVEHMAEVHRRFDVDGTGWLTRAQYKLAFAAVLGTKPLQAELKTAFEYVARTGAQGVVLEHFVTLMTNQIQMQGRAEHIRELFLALDVDGVGYLTLDNMLAASNRAIALPKALLEEAFLEADRDCDGRISYREFEALVSPHYKNSGAAR